MIIGVMELELFSDQFHSLKDKRQILSSIKTRLRHQFNVALAETAGQDLWQRAELTVVSVALEKGMLENTFRQIEELLLNDYALPPLRVEINYL